MTRARHAVTLLGGGRGLGIGSGVLFVAFCVAGCAAPPGSEVYDYLPYRDGAAVKKAVAQDSFPTASQAGIASKVPSEEE